jgi:hypothetical protein
LGYVVGHREEYVVRTVTGIADISAALAGIDERAVA